MKDKAKALSEASSEAEQEETVAPEVEGRNYIGGPIYRSITTKLGTATSSSHFAIMHCSPHSLLSLLLYPQSEVLEVADGSYQHAGHWGMRGSHLLAA